MLQLIPYHIYLIFCSLHEYFNESTLARKLNLLIKKKLDYICGNESKSQRVLCLYKYPDDTILECPTSEGVCTVDIHVRLLYDYNEETDLVRCLFGNQIGS